MPHKSQTQPLIIYPFWRHNLEQEKKNHFHFFLISILVNIQKQRIKADGKHQDLNQYVFGRGFTLKRSMQEHISHNTFNYWSIH